MPIDGQALHTKSTRTSDEKAARRIAYEFYGECLVQWNLANGTLPTSSDSINKNKFRFDRIADRWIDYLKANSGDDDRQQRRWKDYAGSATSRTGFAIFFGKADINSITTHKIQEFIQWKKTKSTKGTLAGTTIKRTIVALNMMLKWAYGEQLLTSVPLMPKVKITDNPRAWFEHSEYKRLHIVARAKAKKCKAEGNAKGYEEWNELSDFIVFMVGSFLRPSEWPYIKHRHVIMNENSEHPHLAITVVMAKTTPRQSVTMGTCIAPYKRIVKRNGKEPESYLFRPAYSNRNTAKERMTDLFEILLRECGLQYNAYGKKRSTYSLRHTSLMLRFIKGDNVNILALAKNAGTSVDQLERFYLSKISPASKIASIQSFK